MRNTFQRTNETFRHQNVRMSFRNLFLLQSNVEFKNWSPLNCHILYDLWTLWIQTDIKRELLVSIGLWRLSWYWCRDRKCQLRTRWPSTALKRFFSHVLFAQAWLFSVCVSVSRLDVRFFGGFTLFTICCCTICCWMHLIESTELTVKMSRISLCGKVK